MVTNPIEGRRFYHRLESAQTFRVKLLGRHRDLGHMIEYRQLLQSLGCEPDTNPAWAQSEFVTRFISRMQRGVERY
jgi:pentatricopeptide repeat protein